MTGAARAIVAIGLVAASAGRAAADDWEARAPAAVDVEVGQAAAVSLTIAPGPGRTISQDGPVRIELASNTLTLKRTRYERRHAADPAADAPRFDLAITAPAEGAHTLAIDARFWVCGPRVCRPARARRTVTVRAAAPPPPPPPPDAGQQTTQLIPGR